MEGGDALDILDNPTNDRLSNTLRIAVSGAGRHNATCIARNADRLERAGGRLGAVRWQRGFQPPAGLRLAPKNEIIVYRKGDGGERGIRTLGKSLQTYGGLANRCLQPLGHLSSAMRMR
jgi:hypothetical protein